MGSKMYGKLLPEYEDLDNKTKTAPGFRVYVIENDGGISLQMIHANDDPVTTGGSSIFMNVDEARELIAGLEEAIDRAEPKNVNHPSRGSNC
jgi:ArsR family metal-binding transcriptional regulator